MHRIGVIALTLVLTQLSAGMHLVSLSAQTAVGCDSFTTQEDAQAVFDSNPGDRFGLDPDGNGKACDDLPSGNGRPVADTPGEAETDEEADVIPDGATRAEVVDVVDGDTFTALIGKKRETIRLLGVDAPETRDPDHPVECFGAEATVRTRQLLPEGRRVYLEDHDASRDDSGRLLRYVWTKEPGERARFVNLVLVRRGFAVVTMPASLRHGARLQEAQDRAIKGGEGLWERCGGPDMPLTTIPGESTESSFADPLEADVDSFWRQTFAAVAEPYVSPEGVVNFSDGIDTACGYATALDAAFYCPFDLTIYYSSEFRQAVEEQAGEVAWATVLAHEWGHHIQTVLILNAGREFDPNSGPYPVVVELQADCLAGIYAGNAEARGAIAPDQIASAEAIIGMVGDPNGTPWYDPGAHGGSDERLRWFHRGYAGDLAACEIVL